MVRAMVRSPVDVEAAMAIARVRDRPYKIPFKKGTYRRREVARQRWRRAVKDLGFFQKPDPGPPPLELTIENLLKHTEDHPQLPLLHPGNKFWRWGHYATLDLMKLYGLSQRKTAPEGEWDLPPLQAV